MTVVLVEGLSDQLALDAIARRRGCDLVAEGITIVAMGGATNIGHHLARLQRGEHRQRIAGLCDAREERDFRRELERAGFGVDLDRSAMEALGFFVCVSDLEDELIRALGPDVVVDIIAAQGELNSFRTMQKQPAQLGRPIDAQLRRFLGTRSGRKARYAPLLVDAVDLTRVPRPLDRLLTHVRHTT